MREGRKCRLVYRLELRTVGVEAADGRVCEAFDDDMAGFLIAIHKATPLVWRKRRTAPPEDSGYVDIPVSDLKRLWHLTSKYHELNLLERVNVRAGRTDPGRIVRKRAVARRTGWLVRRNGRRRTGASKAAGLAAVKAT